MKNSQNRWIIGGAIGLASVAIAIDHTRHKLPEPKQDIQENNQQYIDEEMPPCGLDTTNPCGLDTTNPCGLDISNPCGLD